MVRSIFLTMAANSLNGFTILSIQMSSKDKRNPVIHCVYYKEHTVRVSDPALPKGRTLFILNPPFPHTDTLKRVFEKCVGPVETVRMGTHNSNIKPDDTGHGSHGDIPVQIAHVVFRKRESVVKALALKANDSVVECPELSPSDFGILRWKAEYEQMRPDAATLQAQVDADIAAFDDEHVRQKAKLLASKNSKDGWTLVTRKAAQVPTTVGDKVHENSIAKKAKGNKELKNFYRFQQIEARKEQLAQLRRKFDEDKERLSIMRSSRKFKPY